jgi:hypothetical protein
MKIIVRGCFWDFGRFNLYIINRDFESAKHRYSAESYLEILEAEICLIHTILEKGMNSCRIIFLFITLVRSRNSSSSVVLYNYKTSRPGSNPIKHI